MIILFAVVPITAADNAAINVCAFVEQPVGYRNIRTADIDAASGRFDLIHPERDTGNWIVCENHPTAANANMVDINGPSPNDSFVVTIINIAD